MSDVDPVTPATPRYESAPPIVPLDEDAGPLSLHQEINERRARLENTELLRGLRGL